MSSPPFPSSWYTSHLSSHIDSSRRHIQGEPSSSTFHTPAALLGKRSTQLLTPWTPSDKARFFAALSRHSRFRPELIARDIAKSESDVLAYLDLLEAGAGELERTHGKTHGRRDRGHRWARSHRWRSGLAPAARELSDRWVDREEELAQGVRDVVEENERVVAEVTLQKTRKKEVSEVVRRTAEAEGSRPGRAVSREEVRAGLKERWEVEDWGASLGRERLVELDKRLAPAWSGCYAGLVKRRRSDAGANADAEHKPKRSKPGTRKENLRRDDAFMDQLGRIPRDEWTAEQSAVWKVVNNRTNARRRKRKSKLLASGWTEQAIEEQGGVDAVYVGHEAGDAETVPETAPETAVESIKAEEVVSPTPVSELQRYAMERGLDLINYDKVAQMQEHLSPSPPHLTFDILSALRSELLAYLLPLIHHAIIVAEQASLQCTTDNTHNTHNTHNTDNTHNVHNSHNTHSTPNTHNIDSTDSTDNVPKAVETGETGETGEITSEHVYHAMALRGERHPVQASVDAALRIANVSLDPESKRAEFPLCAVPPMGVPWEMMHLVHQGGRRDEGNNSSILFSSKNNHDHDNSDDNDRNDKNDADDSESDDHSAASDSLESTLTHQEDQQLDAALDNVDRELDSLLEADLWRGDVGKDFDERDDPWGARSTQRPLRLDWAEQEDEHDELADDAGAQEAQHAYTRLLLDITKARRERHAKANRREVYSSYHLNQLGAAMRRGKGEAIVVSEESEMDLGEDDGEAASEAGD